MRYSSLITARGGLGPPGGARRRTQRVRTQCRPENAARQNAAQAGELGVTEEQDSAVPADGHAAAGSGPAGPGPAGPGPADSGSAGPTPAGAEPAGAEPGPGERPGLRL